MSDIEKIKEIIDPVLEDMGYELVRLQFKGDEGSHTLQIMAERQEDGLLAIENCEEISRSLSAILDVEDIISDKYHLEVSSPGVDRPLTRLKDFENYKDFDVKIELESPISDEIRQKKFRGLLLGTNEENVQIKTDEGEFEFAFSLIKKAKLVLTDELLKAASS